MCWGCVRASTEIVALALHEAVKKFCPLLCLQQAQCLMTHSLLDYLTLDQESLTGRGGDLATPLTYSN